VIFEEGNMMRMAVRDIPREEVGVGVETKTETVIPDHIPLEIANRRVVDVILTEIENVSLRDIIMRIGIVIRIGVISTRKEGAGIMIRHKNVITRIAMTNTDVIMSHRLHRPLNLPPHIGDHIQSREEGKRYRLQIHH
jgi:hypothetical protein